MLSQQLPNLEEFYFLLEIFGIDHVTIQDFGFGAKILFLDDKIHIFEVPNQKSYETIAHLYTYYGDIITTFFTK